MELLAALPKEVQRNGAVIAFSAEKDGEPMPALALELTPDELRTSFSAVLMLSTDPDEASGRDIATGATPVDALEKGLLALSTLLSPALALDAASIREAFERAPRPNWRLFECLDEAKPNEKAIVVARSPLCARRWFADQLKKSPENIFSSVLGDVADTTIWRLQKNRSSDESIDEWATGWVVGWADEEVRERVRTAPTKKRRKRNR